MGSSKKFTKFLKGAKPFILFVSLFYLSFYIPLTLIIYMPYWYKLNCNLHTRCEEIGYERSYRGIDELTSFFLHRGELTSFLTKKEKLHLTEVRGIFDEMFFIGIIAIILLVITFERRWISRFAIINVLIILSLLVVLPFFKTFWTEVFHPILFDNDLWKNNRFDLSFYIMPRKFFMYTMVLLIVLCSLINIALWSICRRDR